MRLSFPKHPTPEIGGIPQPGELLAAKGGSPTVAWLCVASLEKRGVYLGIDSDGNIVSGATYNHHSMQHRSRVGKVDLPESLVVAS